MNITYDDETDSMYINLSATKAVDSDEVADGVVLDFGESGEVVGIDIQHASKIADLQTVAFSQANKVKHAA